MRALRAATMGGKKSGKSTAKHLVESKEIFVPVAASAPPPPPRISTPMAVLTPPGAVPPQPRRKREALVAAPQADEPLSRERAGSGGSDSSANSRTGLLHGT